MMTQEVRVQQQREAHHVPLDFKLIIPRRHPRVNAILHHRDILAHVTATFLRVNRQCFEDFLTKHFHASLAVEFYTFFLSTKNRFMILFFVC